MLTAISYSTVPYKMVSTMHMETFVIKSLDTLCVFRYTRWPFWTSLFTSRLSLPFALLENSSSRASVLPDVPVI